MIRQSLILMMLPLMLFSSACFRAAEEESPELAASRMISAERFQRLQETQELILGIAPSPLAPFELKIIQELWSGPGKTIRKVEAPPELLLTFLRSGRVDLVCGGFTDREIRDSFLRPCILYRKLEFVFIRGSEWKESAGDTILLYPDSPPESLFVMEIPKDWKKIPVPREQLWKKRNDAPEKTVLFLSAAALPQEIRQKHAVQEAVPVSAGGMFCFAVRRNDSELAELLEKRFAELQKQGTLPVIPQQPLKRP